MVYPLAEKYLRISGKTVEELAEEVGTSRSTMYYKLNGGSDMSVEMAGLHLHGGRPCGHGAGGGTSGLRPCGRKDCVQVDRQRRGKVR